VADVDVDVADVDVDVADMADVADMVGMVDVADEADAVVYTPDKLYQNVLVVYNQTLYIK